MSTKGTPRVPEMSTNSSTRWKIEATNNKKTTHQLSHSKGKPNQWANNFSFNKRKLCTNKKTWRSWTYILKEVLFYVEISINLTDSTIYAYMLLGINMGSNQNKLVKFWVGQFNIWKSKCHSVFMFNSFWKCYSRS